MDTTRIRTNTYQHASINHILSKFNVKYQMKALEFKASKKKTAHSGNRKKNIPALVCMPAIQPDSSDDEELGLDPQE